MIKLYGIKHCDSVKKARAWLAAHNIDYCFIDFKTTAPDAALLQSWLAQQAVSTLINTRGSTWRKLSPAQQAQAQASNSAIDLMIAYPSLIKRPVLCHQGQIMVGFDANLYAQCLLPS